jgi:hypothetical protein
MAYHYQHLNGGEFGKAIDALLHTVCQPTSLYTVAYSQCLLLKFQERGANLVQNALAVCVVTRHKKKQAFPGCACQSFTSQKYDGILDDNDSVEKCLDRAWSRKDAN